MNKKEYLRDPDEERWGMRSIRNYPVTVSIGVNAGKFELVNLDAIVSNLCMYIDEQDDQLSRMDILKLTLVAEGVVEDSKVLDIIRCVLETRKQKGSRVWLPPFRRVVEFCCAILHGLRVQYPDQYPVSDDVKVLAEEALQLITKKYYSRLGSGVEPESVYYDALTDKMQELDCLSALSLILDKQDQTTSRFPNLDTEDFMAYAYEQAYKSLTEPESLGFPDIVRKV